MILLSADPTRFKKAASDDFVADFLTISADQGRTSRFDVASDATIEASVGFINGHDEDVLMPVFRSVKVFGKVEVGGLSRLKNILLSQLVRPWSPWRFSSCGWRSRLGGLGMKMVFQRRKENGIDIGVWRAYKGIAKLPL